MVHEVKMCFSDSTFREKTTLGFHKVKLDFSVCFVIENPEKTVSVVLVFS